MKYYIGVDGGGSKTDVLLCDASGCIVKYIRGSGSNPISIGGEAACQNVNNLLEYCLDGINKSDIGFISVCIPGIKQYRHNIEILRYFIYHNKAEVTGDEENAFYASLAKEYGIVILSGTGSFATGINKNGEKLTVGGWGPILGDEGSGYFIGIQAIKAAIAQYEYLGPYTLLTSYILEYFEIDGINMLKKAVYKDGINAKLIASLSKFVLKGAEEGDAVSLKILNESATHLFDMANIIIKRLNMFDGEYELCLTGGISNFGDYILDPLSNMIYEKYKNISLIKPIFEPCIGSLLLSFRRDSIEITDGIINNLKTSFKGACKNVI